MAAGAWTFPNSARTDMLNGTFDHDTDSFKVALFLSTSNIGASSTTYAGVTNEHSNANGYTTGGIAVTLTLSGTTTVTVDFSTDPVWTASGGSITARFAVLYEVSGRVLCYCLLDSTPADVTATTGNTLTVAAHASGVFTLA
jgi:putative effector of murein hydrolase